VGGIAGHEPGFARRLSFSGRKLITFCVWRPRCRFPCPQRREATGELGSRSTIKRGSRSNRGAGRGGLQPVTQPGRRRRLSPPRWRPGRCATPGPFPPVPCAGRRGLPARMRSIPHPLHTYAAACRPALTAKPAVRPAGGCCGGGLTDKVPGQGGHECNGRPWEALCGCSGRDDKLSCAAAQISMS